jgi:anion-transporting  ArsA/GET3 family ATPase
VQFALALLLLAVIISFVIVMAFVVGTVAVLNKSGKNSVPPKMPESQYVSDARKLVDEIKETLKTSPLDGEQRAAVLRQVRDVPDNVTKAVRKLHRLRRLKKIAKRSEDMDTDTVLSDIKEMERRIQAELRRTHEMLLSVPISLMKVDTARGDRNLDRIVTELSATNQRLNDIASTYEDMKTQQSYS